MSSLKNIKIRDNFEVDGHQPDDKFCTACRRKMPKNTKAVRRVQPNPGEYEYIYICKICDETHGKWTPYEPKP